MHIDPHAKDWVAASIFTLMVWRLPWSHLKVVEIAFAVQMYVMLFWFTWPLWAALDKLINLPLETSVICFCRKYPAAQVLLVAHILLKIYIYADIDCDWQYPVGPLPVAIWCLNCAIICVLLAYTFRKENDHGLTADNQS